MIWKCAQGHINMEDENGCQKCNSSLYGHSVAVADEICRKAIKDWDDTGKLLVSRGIMADLIQTAIDEATSALRAQLAERDAQLGAVSAELKALGEVGQHLCEGLEQIANRQFCTTLPDLLDAPVAVAQATLTRSKFFGRATRQPTQDKGE